jgi:saccharopine dehydrogenase-like NADP-dependent oxidoreductase
VPDTQLYVKGAESWCLLIHDPQDIPIFADQLYTMKKILILGAGRSASSLIQYLLEQASINNWQVTVGDVSKKLVEQKTKGHASARVLEFDIHNTEQREQEIQNADLVISMLPASMHLDVARDCVRFKKHLLTASYVSKEIGELDSAAREAGMLLLNEAGLDPGLDHMSAMKVIDQVHAAGGVFTSFRSYCGGLVAPENNDNPWGYKFSWNPRNVILAGQGTAQYIEDGAYKYIPYNRLFLQTEPVSVEGHGAFEAYANRDSLSYRKPYGLEHIPTMLRGTLRMPGYCKAWNAFVKLGLTDDTYGIEDSEHLTYRQLLESFLPPGNGTVKTRLEAFMGKDMDAEAFSRLEWLGIFEERRIGLPGASPAFILQNLLEKKWKLGDADKDMIVMQHQFGYTRKNGEPAHITSSLVVKGNDAVYTAMAKTVGLPLAIAACLVLKGQVKARGVLIPTSQELYEPILKELEKQGIVFQEKHTEG